MKKAPILLSLVLLFILGYTAGITETNETSEAEDIVQEAIHTHENIDSVYEQVESSYEEEGVVNISNVWVYSDGSDKGYRIENTSGEAAYGNVNGTGYRLNKEENTLYQFAENPDEKLQNQEMLARTLEHMMSNDEYSLRYGGEEDINGTPTNKVIFEGETSETEGNQYEVWFDEESHYRLQEKNIIGEGDDLITTVVDHDTNIEHDPELFSLLNLKDENTTTIYGEPEL